MPKEVNLIGQTFGRLTVIEKHPERSNNGSVLWKVKCECGESEPFLIIGSTMKSGNTTSCGCARREKTGNKFRKHGMHGSPEHGIWIDIARRCYNENFRQYKDYGGRGIKMSDEWRNSFDTFYQDMGPRPSIKHSVDRKDNNGDYCKENCRWATKLEQANNTSTNVFYELNGEKLTIAQLSKKYDIPYATMRARLLYLPIEIAIKPEIKFEKYEHDINGIKRTMKDWLHRGGITFSEYLLRRQKGWTVTESLTPVQLRTATIDGITQELDFWVELFGIKDHISLYRKVLDGINFEEAVREITT